jgi:hypothetical protein
MCDVVATAPGSGIEQGHAVSEKFDTIDAQNGASENQRDGYALLLKGGSDQTNIKFLSFRERLRVQLESAPARDQHLIPVTELAPARLMPRRQCRSCHRILPVQLDTREARILAIAGVNRSGKTHFLTQAFLEATRQGSLRPFGFTELAPTGDDNTSETLQKYYYNIQRTRELFDITPAEQSPNQFTIAATINRKEYLIVTHDVSGEAISSATRRATEFGFLRRADALIFLLDPMQFESIVPRIPDALQVPYGGTYQVDLLRHCIDELHQSHRKETPVSVVISKADLLTNFCGITGRWESPAGGDAIAEALAIDQDVRRVLQQLGEEEIIHLMANHPKHLFHAVSALGAPPVGGKLQQGIPVRCSDPLGVSLYRMALAHSQT